MRNYCAKAPHIATALLMFAAEACCNVPAPIAEDVEVCCVNCGDKGCEFCSAALAKGCEAPLTFEDVFGQG